MEFVLGLDLGHRTVPAADRWIQHVIAPLARSSSLTACTHVISRPYPHVTISIVCRGQIEVYRQLHALGKAAFAADQRSAPAEDPPSGEPSASGPPTTPTAALAANDHALRRAGRAVVYPGVERLSGTLRIEEVLATSAIERVTVLDGGPPGSAEPPGDAKLDTRDYVRPQWSCGALTLLVRPTEIGHLVPFEGPLA
ncbi:MAG: hypothetical protein JXA67_08950 [Micromonosporaceae bacterium]|nr:hypothetical protein [Micromonosporaceae bacterium]